MSIVAVAMAVQLGAGESWPDNATLFQPYETDQILLPQFANCLSVKAFLKFSGLPYQVELRTNAEHMSPSGEVPLLQIGRLVISEFEPIVSHIQARGVNISSHLSEEDRADMKSYISMLHNILLNAELYLTWYDETIWSQVTSKRYGAPYPWPLNYIIPVQKRRQQCKQLASLGWTSKSPQQITEDVRTCLQALTEKLGDKKFFFGDKPTELDALVYGHIFTLITTELPFRDLAEVIRAFPKLIKFATQVDRLYFLDQQLLRDT